MMSGIFKKKEAKVIPFTQHGVRHVTINGMRLHMRWEKPDQAQIWVNGAYQLVLNREAADITEALIQVYWKYQGDDIFSGDAFWQEMFKQLRKKYGPGVSEEMLKEDINKVFATYLNVAKGQCPTIDLGLPVTDIKAEDWTAPSRMDLALTYRCQNSCSFCYCDGPRTTQELKTDQWKKIIANLWQIGVPNILFTGGEPTLRADLVELILEAEQFVTGLVTNGRNLSVIASELHDASLDYIQVSLEAGEPAVHDAMVGASGAWRETVKGIEAALAAGHYVTTNTTLTKENAPIFPDMLRFGKQLGLKTMGCNSLICSGKGPTKIKQDGLSTEELKVVLSRALVVARELGIELVWYTPTCYNDLNPIKMGFGIKGCSAAQYNMTIEPDGRVIPCQSWIHEGCGNILTDNWETIWKNPICLALRDKTRVSRRECADCQYWNECGGGCPLEMINMR
jgi:radical SAM protein with 4Fe4S-binding SPASM domain